MVTHLYLVLPFPDSSKTRIEACRGLDSQRSFHLTHFDGDKDEGFYSLPYKILFSCFGDALGFSIGRCHNFGKEGFQATSDVSQLLF